MAVPRRQDVAVLNTHSRRSQWKATAPTLAACSNRACRQPKPPHTVCPHCGVYDGRQIVRVGLTPDAGRPVWEIGLRGITRRI